MAQDHAADLVREIDALSPDSLCGDWKDKWRTIAVTAQTVLQVLYPPGAKLLGVIIEFIDRHCGGP